MSEFFPASTRQAVLVFHFADRIKAEILLASRLLSAISQLQGLEQEGANRLFLEFLKGLEQEIGLAQVQINDPEMVRVKTVMTGLLGMADSRMFQDMQGHFTWMISIMATYAQRAMEYLVKEKLL
ncbi:MAG: hypothetical protein NTW80_13915 [Deltaproteobacteria bacterium]|nr:hypothetical protein [Deltaproteobacteria bacterium]